MANSTEAPWFLKSTKPVLFPEHEALTISQKDFDAFLENELASAFKEYDMASVDSNDNKDVEKPAESDNPFIAGLHKHDPMAEQWKRRVGVDAQNKTMTTNGDIANKSTNDVLVDLFHELKDGVEGGRLVQLLDSAWAEDPEATLKIIFNARSIHLGKSTRKVFYRAAGWLAQNHPRTLLANLAWLSQPVIEKKKKEEDGELVSAEPENDVDSPHIVEYGMSHGYWKDILNILALGANGKLDPLADPSDVLNVEDKFTKQMALAQRNMDVSKLPNKKRAKLFRDREQQDGDKKEHPEDKRKTVRKHRHDKAILAFNSNEVYKLLHLTTARLFADQLISDMRAYRHGDAKAKRKISLCAKWAPSDNHFHERHTFIITSIAEIMYPRSKVPFVTPEDSRERYLRHARELYRRDVSALRKHLDVVERKLTAGTFDKIDYAKVPSLAMNANKFQFIEKDTLGFSAYLKDVASGKKTISGATLLPSTIMSQVRKVEGGLYRELSVGELRRRTAKGIMQHHIDVSNAQVMEGQWKAIVDRMKQSGELSSALAVCDVSGSMYTEIARDGTQAIDASIGLSMLVAETTKAPFQGTFITFSTNPEAVKLDSSLSLVEKYKKMKSANWSMSTNFVGVFRDLILPVAVNNKIAPEDMVKRIFVFSDMQFDAAQGNTRWNNGGGSGERWESSYETLQGLYADAGYDMPELVFWDLAGSRKGGNVQTSLAPPEGYLASTKPVTAADVGTCLVSGYSQGMLKVFMEGGSFREAKEPSGEEEDIQMVDEGDSSDAVVVERRQANAMSPRALVDKAINHPAYDMFKVYD